MSIRRPGFARSPCEMRSVARTANADGESLRPIGVLGSSTSVFPGWTYRLWVIDLEGEPVTIMAAHGPQTTPTELAELNTMVEDLNFVAPR